MHDGDEKGNIVANIMADMNYDGTDDKEDERVIAADATADVIESLVIRPSIVQMGSQM